MSGHLLLCRNQSGDPNQVIGDQIEQKIGGDGSDAAVFGLAHGAVVLAPSKMHSVIARRICDMP